MIVLERIQKVLARAGVDSRRGVESKIAEGRVSINGKTIHQMGAKIDVARDKICVDGLQIQLDSPDQSTFVYYLLNKPPKIITTTKDDRQRKIVLDFLPKNHVRVFPVGRLDYDAEGALLLTNDGELANRLLHPKYTIPKTYLAKVKGCPSKESINTLRKGVKLKDGNVLPLDVNIYKKMNMNTWVEIMVTEGRNHMVKRLFDHIGHSVKRLVRSNFATLSLGALAIGDYRSLTNNEVKELKRLVGLL